MQDGKIAEIIRGRVLFDGRWITIDEKIYLQENRNKKIGQGLVWFQGRWMGIEEKIRLLNPAPPPKVEPAEAPGPKVVINQNFSYTDNRSFQTNDQRTFTTEHHEHRHVHVNPLGERRPSEPVLDISAQAGASSLPGGRIKSPNAIEAEKRPQIQTPDRPRLGKI